MLRIANIANRIMYIVFAYYTYIQLFTRKKFKKSITKNNCIVHINSLDFGGGAAKIAHDLFAFQKSQGYTTMLLVQKKNSEEKDCFEIELIESKQQDVLNQAQKYLQWQDFFHLSSFNISKLQITKDSDIIHLHNLHSWHGYFSPFALPELCSIKPLVWTLHDMQAVTGHCAHSFDCKKWQIGCGNCPYLDIYPKLTKDTTSFIWKTKKRIYKKCDMHIVVPSKWLQHIVSQSILSHLPCTLIYNGIDTDTYKPYNKQDVRTKFGLPQEKNIILFSADLGIANPFKGGDYIQKLINKYAQIEDILFVNIGGERTIEKSDIIWNVPYVQEQTEMAQWYSAADVYVYPSLADNCPLVVLEAMACGLPIVTFNTGGIPELVIHNETGYIAKYKDFNDLCVGFELMLNNIEIRKSMAEKSKNRIRQHFTLDKMNTAYMQLYSKL